ncbi:MAG: NAD(P) transhydrogenase subunit alpha [Planctomycetota bacterium]|nr:MAG: NAD(P) transhydrogenase subunit alpha [Planctomycetota bacterium]
MFLAEASVIELFTNNFVVFILAMFIGFEVIAKVPPILHTPLMSGSNAISGITIVGAMVIAGLGRGWWSEVLGFLAVAFAMVNVVGGYRVTDRMLAMFQKK